MCTVRCTRTHNIMDGMGWDTDKGWGNSENELRFTKFNLYYILPSQLAFSSVFL